MSDTIWDVDAPIGRRSVPRSVGEMPASGVSWSGPTEFVVREERPGVFRWLMVSSDSRRLHLAQSASFLPSAAACEREIRCLDPSPVISFETVAADF